MNSRRPLIRSPRRRGRASSDFQYPPRFWRGGPDDQVPLVPNAVPGNVGSYAGIAGRQGGHLIEDSRHPRTLGGRSDDRPQYPVEALNGGECDLVHNFSFRESLLSGASNRKPNRALQQVWMAETSMSSSKPGASNTTRRSSA